nr:reverse transcriptase domain-containing protein [Tanacetum cinerariifolium]
MTLELANRAICTPDGIARDVFVPVGKFTFPADFVVVDYESDPRVPLILGRPFLRTARALIDVHDKEMIPRDGDERLTLNMKHDTTSYSNHPYRESVKLINIFNLSKIASPEVIPEFYDSKGCNFLSEELPDIDSSNDIHPHFDDDPLSGSTIYSANSLLVEFADELAFISYPPDYDDNRACDIESDIREKNFCFSKMFTDEQPLDYSFPLRFDVYPDDFLEIESDATFDDDSFDSEGEKIKEAELFLLFQEMFTEEQPPDYSFPPRINVYPDDFLEIESDAAFDDDSFDSEGEKINEAKLLIDPLISLVIFCL